MFCNKGALEESRANRLKFMSIIILMFSFLFLITCGYGSSFPSPHISYQHISISYCIKIESHNLGRCQVLSMWGGLFISCTISCECRKGYYLRYQDIQCRTQERGIVFLQSVHLIRLLKNFEVKVDVQKRILRLREKNDNMCDSFNQFMLFIIDMCFRVKLLRVISYGGKICSVAFSLDLSASGLYM